MAHLGTPSTDGRLSFQKYVTDNKRFKEVEYEIEKGKPASLVSSDGIVITDNIRVGTKLKIVDPNYTTIGKMKYAHVNINRKKGYIAINSIRKPTGGNGTQYEDEVVDAINNYILEAGGVINLKIAGDNKTYSNLTAAVKVDSKIKSRGGVRGDPKADIIVCRDKTKPLDSGSIYISHKKAGGAKEFQQYSGLSEQSGLMIYNNSLTQKFLGEVVESLDMGKLDKLPYPIMGTFKNDKLALVSIYGPDYGKQYSLQHVQLIGQGHPVFKRVRDELYEITFTSHMSVSGDLSLFTGGYAPVFGATFRNNRSFMYKGRRYGAARVGIYPKILLAGRGGIKVVEIKE
jgi:hypothetical protein